MRKPHLLRGWIHRLGVDPVGSTPDEQMRVYKGEIRLWSEAAKISNFRP